MEMYLTLGYVSFFTIHSRYIQDIQDTLRIQCILTLRYMTHKIHTRYTHDTCRIQRDTFEDTYLEPYLRPRLDARGDEFEIHVSHHVSRMYPACILITLADIHVSRMYPACILHLRYVPLRIHLRYTYPNMYLGSIPHVSLMYPRTTRYIYPACILDA